MRVEGVFVGRPREIELNGKKFKTSIFKQAVDGPVVIAGNNMAGDEQSDLRVHGGTHKAIFAYPTDHYEYWRTNREQLGALPYGSFGENLTIAGALDEGEVKIGDLFQVGSAILMASEPRLPCFKLGIRLNDPAIIFAYRDAERYGTYFKIVEAGKVQNGDEVKTLQTVNHDVTIRRFGRWMAGQAETRETLENWLRVLDLSDQMRAKIEKKMGSL